MLPMIYKCINQFRLIFEVPVEAGFRDIESTGQGLNVETLGPLSANGIERGREPVRAGSPVSFRIGFHGAGNS
jgi:hypothetical protein